MGTRVTSTPSRSVDPAWIEPRRRVCNLSRSARSSSRLAGRSRAARALTVSSTGLARLLSCGPCCQHAWRRSTQRRQAVPSRIASGLGCRRGRVGGGSTRGPDERPDLVESGPWRSGPSPPRRPLWAGRQRPAHRGDEAAAPPRRADAPDHRRTIDAGDPLIRRPVIDIGELTTTRSSSSPISTSALVGECTPPSTNSSPSTLTGLKNPGIADDAATASGSGGLGSRFPNANRRPSSWRTAHSHSAASGQSSGNRPAIVSEIMAVLTWPSGMRLDSSAHGGAENGRVAIRVSTAAISAGRRPRSAGRSGGGRRAGPTLLIRSEPSRDSERSSYRARRSAAESPARSDAAAIEPADVPTMIVAFLGSQPIPACNALSTPAWKAPPVTPPAPRTKPIRAGGAVTLPSLSCLRQRSRPDPRARYRYAPYRNRAHTAAVGSVRVRPVPESRPTGFGATLGQRRFGGRGTNGEVVATYRS